MLRSSTLSVSFLLLLQNKVRIYSPETPRSPKHYLVALDSMMLLIMLLSSFSLSIRFSNIDLRLMWQTTFQTHIKQQEKLPFCFQQQTTVDISELHDSKELLNLILF